MPPTIRDFRGRGSASQQDAELQRIRQLKLIQAAKVEAEHLTGDPKWDHLLQRIQANINLLEPIAEELRRAIPTMFLEHEIRSAQLTYSNVFGQIQSLRQVLSMPKDIFDNYEKFMNEPTPNVVVVGEA